MKYLEHGEYDLGLINNLTIVNHIPKPVDTTCGLSTCTYCGAKYAGKMEDPCFNVVPFISLPGDFMGSPLLKDVVKNANSPYACSDDKHRLTYGKVVYKKCDKNRFTWDLQTTQDEYTQFINFLRTITSHVSDYNKFKQYLTPKANELLLNSLPDRIVQLEQQNKAMRDAINEIAYKINSAGNCLSF